MDRLSCLRRMVANSGTVKLAPGPITTDTMEPLAKARMGGGMVLVGLKSAGVWALNDLTELIIKQEARYARGAAYSDLSEEVFSFVLEELFERDVGSITSADVAALDRKLRQWFRSKVSVHTLFVPCAISVDHLSPIKVGPVRFLYIDDFRAEYADALEDAEFDRLFTAMGERRVYWIAIVEVGDAHPARAAEMGDIAVDLALTAIQMSVPGVNAPAITRMDGRSLPPRSIRISKVGSRLHSSFTSSRSGRAIAAKELERYLSAKSRLMTSAGRRVRGYLTGRSVLPVLDQGWADAAFWLHEGLSEPLDTIAVPKLETAIEVLLRAEKSSGSTKRLIKAIRSFYGLEPDQVINPESAIKVKQFADRLVEHRSRILHGTLSTLTSLVGSSRNSLTTLCVELIGGFTIQLDRYARLPGCRDEVDAFLGWLDERRHKSKST